MKISEGIKMVLMAVIALPCELVAYILIYFAMPSQVIAEAFGWLILGTVLVIIFALPVSILSTLFQKVKEVEK